MKRFYDGHPAVVLSYLLGAVVFTLVFPHPLFLGVSVAAAVVTGAVVGGRRFLRFLMSVMLPVALLTALLNPVFSHAGVTVLDYLPDGNPFTAESVIYGGCAGLTLVAAGSFLYVLGTVFSSDKAVYLAGRLSPSAALTFAMTLRFLPRYAERFQAVKRAAGEEEAHGFPAKVKGAVSRFSAVTAYALESAPQTAKVMRARGYGTTKRTAFAVYRFTRDEGIISAFLVLSAAGLTAAALTGVAAYRVYPSVKSAPFGTAFFAALAGYAAYCSLPVICGIGEVIRWKRSLSKG